MNQPRLPDEAQLIMETITYTYDDVLFAQLYDFIVERSGRGNQGKGWEFFKRCAELFGSPILEMGCGTGLNLLAFAEMGYSVTGLDNSPAMLKILEEKLSHAKPEVRQNVQFIEGDMVNPPLSSNFRLIIFANSQFLHLQTDEQRLACLKNTRRLLADDGVVLICNGKLTEAETWDEWREEAGSKSDEWILLTRCGWKSGAFQEELKLIPKSQGQQEHLFHWHLYPIEDAHMKQLAAQAGLMSMPVPSNLPETFHPRFRRCAFCIPKERGLGV